MDPKTLREWRAKKGFSVRALAELTGVPQGTLQALEQGRREHSALWAPLERITQLIDRIEELEQPQR